MELVEILIFTAACAGNEGTDGVQSPPPAPDFLMELSSDQHFCESDFCGIGRLRKRSWSAGTFRGITRRYLRPRTMSVRELAAFDSKGNLVAGSAAPMPGTISHTFRRARLPPGGVTHFLLLDANLNFLGNYSSAGPAGLVFSRDG